MRRGDSNRNAKNKELLWLGDERPRNRNVWREFSAPSHFLRPRFCGQEKAWLARTLNLVRGKAVNVPTTNVILPSLMIRRVQLLGERYGN